MLHLKRSQFEAVCYRDAKRRIRVWRRVACFAAAFVLAFVSCGTAQAQEGNSPQRRGAQPKGDVVISRNIEYARVGEKRLLLDIAVPKNVQRPPLVVWVHGGGWRKGSKGNGGRIRGLVAQGFAIASINYRLSGEAQFPAQIHDCKAAIRWLRAHAKKYGYDAKRIGAAGSSAGGHLVALLATSGGVAELEGEVGGNVDRSSRVQAVCDLWGPTDFLQLDAHAIPGGRLVHNAANSPEAQLIGGPIQENKEKVARANPITYVDHTDPPLLIIHGEQDAVVPVHQSELLVKACQRAGVPVQYHALAGEGHGAKGFPPEKMNALILAFFQKHLQVKPDNQAAAIRQAAGREFVDLFDGKTLAGWQPRRGRAKYEVQDGAIVGHTAKEGPNTFLCTTRDYANFELELEVRCDPGLNSGIQIRSHVYAVDTPQRSKPKRIRKAGETFGYQVEISANGNAGRIWDEGRDTKWHDAEPSDETKKAYRPGEWNRYRIVAVGNHIRTWINGVAIADIHDDNTDDANNAEGFIGLQVHRIRPDAGPFEVRWRNIRIRELSVHPGINKSFENVKPVDFVERFEKEGREIFDLRNQIVSACDITPGMTIADIGAGTGLFTRLLASATGEKGKVYAVDIAEEFVAHIEQTCRDLKLKNVQGVVCMQDNVMLPPQSIDLAFVSATYHHFEFPHQTLTSIRRALRPGGRLIVIDFRRQVGKSSPWILNHVRAGQSVVTREILAAGFKLAEEKELLKDQYFLIFQNKKVLP